MKRGKKKVFIWVLFVFTANFWSGSCDESRDESADDADAQAAETDGEERGQSQGDLLTADVLHRWKGHHHCVQDHRHGICKQKKRKPSLIDCWSIVDGGLIDFELIVSKRRCIFSVNRVGRHSQSIKTTNVDAVGWCSMLYREAAVTKARIQAYVSISKRKHSWWEWMATARRQHFFPHSNVRLTRLIPTLMVVLCSFNVVG